MQVEADHLLARGLHLQEGRRRDGDVHRVLRGCAGEHLCLCDSEVQFCSVLCSFVQVSICAFVILILSFVVGQGGGWTQ